MFYIVDDRHSSFIFNRRKVHVGTSYVMVLQRFLNNITNILQPVYHSDTRQTFFVYFVY